MVNDLLHGGDVVDKHTGVSVRYAGLDEDDGLMTVGEYCLDAVHRVPDCRYRHDDAIDMALHERRHGRPRIVEAVTFGKLGDEDGEPEEG